MGFTNIKENIFMLWNFIGNLLFKIINLLFNKSSFYGLSTELDELKTAVTNFVERVNYGLEHDTNLEQAQPESISEFQEPISVIILRLNDLKAKYASHKNQYFYWRLWYYPDINAAREEYGRTIISALKQSLTQSNKEDACKDFVGLCEEHLVILAEDEQLQAIYQQIKLQQNSLAHINYQHEGSQPVLSMVVCREPSESEQFVTQLKQILDSPQKIVLMNVVHMYKQLLYKYSDISDAELKELQRRIKLKLHPDKNMDCHNEAQEAFLCFKSIDEMYITHLNAQMTWEQKEAYNRNEQMIKNLEMKLEQDMTELAQIRAEKQQIIEKTQQLEAETQQLEAETQRLKAETQQREAETQQLEAKATELRQKIKEQEEQERCLMKNQPSNAASVASDEQQTEPARFSISSYFKI